ncbi:MAG: hypothetical protein MR613_05765, partial [Prevotella sp.]|nr:hypothetical protein [Prevotella sp.]
RGFSLLNHSVGFISQRLKGIENCWSKGKAKVKCLHMQLIAILSRIGANRATCALHKYAADALTIHNENIPPLGG